MVDKYPRMDRTWSVQLSRSSDTTSPSSCCLSSAPRLLHMGRQIFGRRKLWCCCSLCVFVPFTAVVDRVVVPDGLARYSLGANIVFTTACMPTSAFSLAERGCTRSLCRPPSRAGLAPSREGAKCGWSSGWSEIGSSLDLSNRQRCVANTRTWGDLLIWFGPTMFVRIASSSDGAHVYCNSRLS